MTYCVEVKTSDRTCACKGGKKSKCPNDDKQIAKGTRATSPFQTFSNLPSKVARSPRPAFPQATSASAPRTRPRTATSRRSGGYVLDPHLPSIRARRVSVRPRASRLDAFKKRVRLPPLTAKLPSSRSQHLCCLTPKVLENIKNAGGLNTIQGYRATGMKEAFAVVRKQGTYEEVQAAWKAAQSPAKDAENVDPDAAAIKKRKAAEEPASAENQVAT